MSANLYKFATLTESWLYTDARTAIIYGGQTYAPEPIKRSEWSRSVRDIDLQFTMPITLNPCPLYAAGAPSGVVWVTVMATDGTALSKGKVISCRFNPTRDEAELRVKAISLQLLAELPVRRFSPTCNWNLGDTSCGVSLASFGAVLPLGECTISGFTIEHATIGLQTDGYWTGGYLENGFERQYIIAHAGNIVTLMAPFVALNSVTFTISPGCDKAKATCAAKFSNLINFGGLPFVPDKNPVVMGY